jgi:lauroyl/myristoyl acyltransferase
VTAALRGLPVSSAETKHRARRRVVEDAVQAELEWRPWLWRKLEFDGLEHLQAARELRDGRVIVATLHLGPYPGLIHGLAAHGLKLYISQSDEYATAVALHGRRGRWTVQQVRWLEEAGCRIIRRGRSYRVFRALLNRGEACWFAVDAAGRVDLQLAGHAVRVQVGVAALALETGAPILPALIVRRKWRQRGILFPPVDPADFTDPAAVTQHVFEVLGPILAAETEQADLNFLRLGDFA